MVNFGLNAAAILGLFLAVAGAGLFFLRSIRPELARDYDIFFAAVGLLCGIILLFNGWRLDPILQFGQFLLTGTTIFFAFESIRMRGVATEQARRNTPIVDRDRPVSRTRVYTDAELDKFDNTYDDYDAKPNYNSPRLRGYDDPTPRTTRRTEPRRRASPTDLRDEPRRRPSRNRPEPTGYVEPNPKDIYPDVNKRPRRRPSTPPIDDYSDRTTPPIDDYSDRPNPGWLDNPRASRPRRPQTDPYSEPTPPPTPPRRRPNPADLGRSYEPDTDYGSDDLGNSYDDSDLGRSYQPEDEQPIAGDYVVDYQPLDDTDDYSDDYDDGDEYDDYDDPQSDRPNEYDDYSAQPERRKPINFNDYE